MQRGWWVFGALAGVALVIGASAIAYRAVTHDWDDETRVIQVAAPSSGESGAPAEVIRVVDDRGWRGHDGFFPGFFFFPLLFFGFILLLFWGLGRGRWGGGGGNGPGRFEEWHRRQHETDTSAPA